MQAREALPPDAGPAGGGGEPSASPGNFRFGDLFVIIPPFELLLVTVISMLLLRP